MGDKNMKNLAKKKAKIEADEPDVFEMKNPKAVDKYEKTKDSDRALDYAKKNTDWNGLPPPSDEKYPMPDRKADDEEDHMSRNPKVKQMRKWNMLRGLIGVMDDMDGDGKAD